MCFKKGDNSSRFIKCTFCISLMILMPFFHIPLQDLDWGSWIGATYSCTYMVIILSVFLSPVSKPLKGIRFRWNLHTLFIRWCHCAPSILHSHLNDLLTFLYGFFGGYWGYHHINFLVAFQFLNTSTTKLMKILLNWNVHWIHVSYGYWNGQKMFTLVQ